ncbi:MAG: Gfo/Idh/MocA family oxidoreductase [Chloroflexota bacterium]|nr:Gfo/Idh/MocA family oxidoreductase [Chloroflexota bacterium]
MAFQVGIIGCGRPLEEEEHTGFGMAHAHVRGYEASPDAELVALADIKKENAEAFQKEHGGERIYTDYHEMLEEEALDIVSICTWPHLHAEMVIACAEAGVKAVHCEKPMAPTYGEAVEMARVCEARGVQLTFNHQRRFGAPFRKAKALLDEGAIGDLIRLEASCSNMFDWGTHWFDMLFFYNDETPVEWVIGQIEPRGGQKIFGVPVEGQGISHFKYRNGVHGLMVTGFEAEWEASNRLVGTKGVIEVGHSQDVPLRTWVEGQGAWQVVELEEGLHGQDYVKLAVLDVIDALKTGREPELAARKALQATELIFATYESSRRRGRVDLPLDIEDSPLLSMLESGEMEGDFPDLAW